MHGLPWPGVGSNHRVRALQRPPGRLGFALGFGLGFGMVLERDRDEAAASTSAAAAVVAASPLGSSNAGLEASFHELRHVTTHTVDARFIFCVCHLCSSF